MPRTHPPTPSLAGSGFKTLLHADAYFYIAVRPGAEHEVETALRRKFALQLNEVVLVPKEDLALANHLSGLQKVYMQLRFASTRELMDVRRLLLPAVQKNKASRGASEAYDAFADTHPEDIRGSGDGWLEKIDEIRE